MKMSRLPLALALSSALAFGVGCADRNDGMVDERAAPTAAERDAADVQPVAPMATDAQTQADAAYTDPNRGDVSGIGDGRDSDQPVDDTWITTKVKSSLLADSDVSGLDINVDTHNGVVTLSGQVDEQSQIAHATRIARDIDGVSNVNTDALTTEENR